MNGDKPDSFDDLASITMIRDANGDWNLFATPLDGPTIQFRSIFPDPPEAIVELSRVLLQNSGAPVMGAKAQEPQPTPPVAKPVDVETAEFHKSAPVKRRQSPSRRKR